MTIIAFINLSYNKFMNILNRKINQLRFRNAGLKYNNTWDIDGRIHIHNEGKLSIDDNFHANSNRNASADSTLRFIVRKNGELIIGKQVGISNSTIVCHNKIEIGAFVFVGGNCKIWDTDFHSLDPIERVHNGDKKIKTAPIKIEDYAFIGGSSIILKGVTIGKNSIIGAGSVVTQNIPENEIWAGNPARYIKTLGINK